ncbi:hypothetical protein niasHT_013950 [Heterodera trifolii]|uniref:Uncharacterized protein n=1 Tax=Heterodera trifolii TaxID=157864 RepID=A0ABD2L1S4_9BILA
MPSLSGTIIDIAYLILSFEMFTDLSVLAIACLNLAVIMPTKLLHTNLKSILITQSFAVLYFGIVRLVIICQRLIPACEQSSNTTEINLITSALSMVFSFVEYLLIALIGRYNQKMYNRQIETTSSNNYNIGFRYQISDNINSAKQLSATFLFFFLSNLCLTFLYTIALTFDQDKDDFQIALVYAASNLSIAILCFAIELTIVT